MKDRYEFLGWYPPTSDEPLRRWIFSRWNRWYSLSAVSRLQEVGFRILGFEFIKETHHYVC